MRILLFLLFLTVWFNNVTFAQRTCGSEINLESIKQNDPDRYQRIMEMEKHVANYTNQRSLGVLSHHEVITIPVVVHVLHTGQAIGTGLNISDAQIQSQIDVLNEDFRRLNANASQTPSVFQGVAADVEIEFVLACVNPNGNSTNGIVRVQTNVNTFFRVPDPNDPNITNEEATGIKFAPTGSPAWPADRYLNIWVCNLGNNLLGYAQFPDMMATQPETDGVVVHTTAFGRIGNLQANFDQGRTATHEVGHWLNLIHIWGDSICGDDLVEDTPVQEIWTNGCPSHPRPSCGSNDMFMNYMDYTNDACMNIFTQGQTDRMRVLFEPGGIRESFVSCDLIANVCQLPPTLTGPSLVCTSGSTYTIQNAPQGLHITWQVNPGHWFQSTTQNGTGASATIMAASNTVGGIGELQFTTKKEVWFTVKLM